MPLFKLKSNFGSKMSNFQQEGLGCDCILKCPFGEVSAHRNILASSSEGFKNTFVSSKNNQSQTVYFKSLTLSQIKAAVDICYGREVVLSLDDEASKNILKFFRYSVPDKGIKKDEHASKENMPRGRPRKKSQFQRATKTRKKSTKDVLVETENSPNTTSSKQKPIKHQCLVCDVMVKSDLLAGHIERVHNKRRRLTMG